METIIIYNSTTTTSWIKQNQPIQNKNTQKRINNFKKLYAQLSILAYQIKTAKTIKNILTTKELKEKQADIITLHMRLQEMLANKNLIEI